MTADQPDSTVRETRAPPPADRVRAYLEELFEGDRLETSQQRGEFLRYIVEQTLEGREDHLKGFNIAVEVYGRDESFDAQTDPVVRLEARRLRRDLDSHYAGPGRSDPICITIPKGAYVPHFEWRENGWPDAGASSPGATAAGQANPFTHRLLALAITLVVAVALTGLAWKMLAPGDRSGHIAEPHVLVMPFNFSGTGDLPGDLAKSLTMDLVDDLVRFSGFTVIAANGDPARFKQGDQEMPGSGDSPTFVVSGHIIVEHNQLLVWARVAELETEEVLWSDHWERNLETSGVIEVQHELSDAIATAIGEPYGIVVSYSREENSYPEVDSLPSYICVRRAFAYRRGFEADQFASALQCLEHAVHEDPEYSDAWAMLGWLYLDAWRFNFLEIQDKNRQLEKALEAASKALSLDPLNTTALKALSSINYYMGYFEEAEQLMRRALEINPNDPDTLAQFGWRLIARGKSAEGVAALHEAIERSANPPGWYFCLLGVDHYLNDDFESMLAVSRRSMVEGCSLSPALLVIANARLGDRQATRRAFELMAEERFLASDPAAYFRRHGFTDEINEKLVDGLIQAEAFLASGE